MMTKAHVKFSLNFFAKTLMFFCELQKAAKRIDEQGTNAVFPRIPAEPTPRTAPKKPYTATHCFVMQPEVFSK